MSYYQEELEIVRAQIRKLIPGGQSWSAEGRSHERVPLEKLEAREKWLLAQIEREAGGGGIGISRGSPR